MNKFAHSLFKTQFKILETVHPNAAANRAISLFFTPTRYNRPKRELWFQESSRNEIVNIDPKHIKTVYNSTAVENKRSLPSPTFNPMDDKTFFKMYELGNGPKTVLLVHGWGGRASQMGEIARGLAEHGYKVVSFDSIGHGDSPGVYSSGFELAYIIEKVFEKYGRFYAIIGHSIGGVSAARAIQKGVKAEHLITIGAPSEVDFIINEFCHIINASPKTARKIRKFMEYYIGVNPDEFSLSKITSQIEQPGLIIHDKNDKEASIEQAYKLDRSWKTAQLFVTSGLGHRRILRNPKVINKIIDYLKEPAL